jgi:Signal peptidase, peptidase S26
MADEIPPPPGFGMPPPPEGPRAEPMPGAITSATPTTAPILIGAIKVEPPSLPDIALEPSRPKTAPNTTSKSGPKENEAKDTLRELMETVVFVVVLVLMLKTFLAEAFVIPTGSMADTLLGYHYKVSCDQCGYRNLVNASSEAEPQGGGQPAWIVSSQCQNCGETKIIRNVPQIRQGGPQP